MNPQLLLLLAVIAATASAGSGFAATRLALVGSGGDGGLDNVLDAATALLSRDTDLQLLDRAEVGRVLREQEISLAGLARAESAVKAGQLLHADLFAVLEGTPANEAGGPPALGLVVFDAKSGARYADSALLASNAVSAASATAAAVRAVVAKSHRAPQDLHTVGLLLVRNADLPRQFDGLCDSVGRLLESELTASPGIAVLERRRLEQVNKERSLTAGADKNHLLSSLLMMQLDIGRDGTGLRGTLALVGADGTRAGGITASVPARDAVALAHLLAEKTESLLKAPLGGISGDRGAEAARFHREYVLLLHHHDYLAAVRALDAALALRPKQKGWQQEMALLLPDAAVQLVDPGGQNAQRPLATQPASEGLAHCLALGQRGADLLLDLSREAAQAAKPGEPIPEVLTDDYRARLCRLLQKLGGVTTADPVGAAEIAALAGKERMLRTEVLEPFLRRWCVDRASFATYSRTLFLWFDFEPDRSGLPEGGQDDSVALSHWVELSHKLNPPDGSGTYAPISNDAGLGFFTRHRGEQVERLRRALEQDQDPVIRIYARAGRVACSAQPNDRSPDGTLAAERDFRFYAQDLLAHSPAAKPNPVFDHVWGAITGALHATLNHKEGWKECVEACRFAIVQGDIEPSLFYLTAELLGGPYRRKLPEELEIVDGALKLILEKPEAFPKDPGYYDRSDLIAYFQKKREHLAAELAGANTNAPAPGPWRRKLCLMDLTAPVNGLGWLFKPVVQDGQVFAVAAGLREWGLAEDSLQLVRVPLEGGAPSLLGRAEIAGLEFQGLNRAQAAARKGNYLADENLNWLDVARSACIGAACYFAATCSGVFVFPTNGGPALRLGATNGLPSEDIRSVAFLDGRLYVGAGQPEREGYLAAYEPVTRKVSVLASSRRSEHLSPFDDQPPFCTLWLAADPARHRLLMVVSSTVIPSDRIPDITPCMGIWAYLPSTGEYRRLAPLRLPTPPQGFLQDFTWAGRASLDTLAVKDSAYLLALFDLSTDRLLSACGAWAQKSDAVLPLWRKMSPSYPYEIPNGPFFMLDGWFYSSQPFERTALANGKREALPPLRTDYPMRLKESLQLLDDGKHVLAADPYSLWLLELRPEPAGASVDTGNHNPAFGQ